jgi:hypothetical protein
MPPEDLARRKVHEALDGVDRCVGGLEHVVGADQVHPHRADGALQDGVHAGDRRQVNDVGCAPYRLLDDRRIEHVALHESEVRVS